MLKASLFFWSVFIFTIIYKPNPTFCQKSKLNNEIDSLFNLVNIKKNLNLQSDSSFVDLFLELSDKLRTRGNYDKSLENANIALEISMKIDYKKGIINSLRKIGTIYKNKGNFDLAIESHKSALRFSKEYRNERLIAWSYNNLGVTYLNTGNYSEALVNLNNALNIFNKLDNPIGIGSSLESIAQINNIQGDYVQSLNYYFKALKYFEKSKDQSNKSTALNGIALVYENQGDLEGAKLYHLEALKINLEINDKKLISYSYGNLGNINKDQQNYNEALKYFQKSLKLNIELNNFDGISKCYIGIGSVNMLIGDSLVKTGDNLMGNQSYKLALENYLLSLKISDSIMKKIGIALACHRIASVLLVLNRPNDAIPYLERGLNTAIEVGARKTILDFYNSYSNLYKLKAISRKANDTSATIDWIKAIDYLDLSMKVKDSILNIENVEKSAKLKVQYETEKKVSDLNFKQKMSEEHIKQQQLLAFQNNQKFLLKQQEFIISEKERELQKASSIRIQYELSKQKIITERTRAEKQVKDAQVLILQNESIVNENEIAGQKLIQKVIYSGVGVVGLICFLLFNRFQLRKKIESQQAIIDERVRISRELHDDVGAQLSTAKMFLHDLKKNFNNEKGQEMLDNSLGLLDTSIKDLRVVMDGLRQSTLKDKGYIAATEELVEMINRKHEIRFELSHHGINERLPIQAEHHLFRITQELINNTLKYAQAKKVTIDLVKQPEKLVLTYEDDGMGCDLTKIKKGYGLVNMESRIQSLDGHLECNSEPGRGFMAVIEILIKPSA